MLRVTGYLVAAMWAATLLGGAFRPQAGAAGSTPRPDPGYLAPPIETFDLRGEPVSLASLRGKAVFVNFWASWCGPCRLEMPEIQRLADELPGDAAVLTVNMTSQERSPAAVEAYLQAHGYTFAVGMDPQGSIGAAFRVLSLPTSLFISPQGEVIARISGPLSRSAMLDYLRAARR